MSSEAWGRPSPIMKPCTFHCSSTPSAQQGSPPLLSPEDPPPQRPPLPAIPSAPVRMNGFFLQTVAAGHLYLESGVSLLWFSWQKGIRGDLPQSSLFFLNFYYTSNIYFCSKEKETKGGRKGEQEGREGRRKKEDKTFKY